MPRPVSVAVIEAIAEARGVDPIDLEIALGDHIDTDALAQLEARSSADWRVTFEIEGHTVTVTSEREVVVDSVDQYQFA